MVDPGILVPRKKFGNQISQKIFLVQAAESKMQQRKRKREGKISAEVLGRRKFLQKFYSEENFCRNSRQEKISAENLGRRKFLQK